MYQIKKIVIPDHYSLTYQIDFRANHIVPLASHILLELDQLDGGVPAGLPCPALQRCDVVAHYVSAKGRGRVRQLRGGIRHLVDCGQARQDKEF